MQHEKTGEFDIQVTTFDPSPSFLGDDGLAMNGAGHTPLRAIELRRAKLYCFFSPPHVALVFVSATALFHECLTYRDTMTRFFFVPFL